MSTKTKKSANFKSDVTIIGGGGGGLTAAVEAAEKGVDILVLEKRGVLGGNAVRGGGPPKMDFGTPISKMKTAADMTRSDDLFKKAMEWSHWRADGRLVRTLINKSMDTIRWLQDKGTQFDGFGNVDPENPPDTFGFGPGLRGVVYVDELIKYCKKLNIKFLRDTRAKKLVVDKNGRISGVIAESGDGDVQIDTKSVIISTGGFLGNRELMKKYFHSYDEKLFDNVNMGGLPHMGDGLLMAQEIGAAVDSTVAFEWNGNRFPWLLMRLPLSCSALVEVCDSGMHPEPIWVNKKGIRFADETSGQGTNSLYRQPDKTCYTIFDEKMKEKILANPLKLEGQEPLAVRLEEEFQEFAKKDKVKKANSWDEIAKWIGATPEVLKATIAEYNSFCDKGYDATFLKDPKHLVPLQTPPYYAIESRLNMLVTRGPLKVNDKMAVLDGRDDPIPGLYAAGVDIGGTDSDTYCSILRAHSIGFTIASARIAAENAVQFTKEN